MPPQEFELWTCSQGNTVLTTWPMRGFKMLVTDPFVAQGLHTQIDLIISLSWASGSGSHSPASTT